MSNLSKLTKSDLVSIVEEQEKTINQLQMVADLYASDEHNTTDNIKSVVIEMSEYNQSNILRDMCWSADNKIKFNNKTITNVVSELRDLLEHFNGSEPQDDLIGKKREFIETLEAQSEELEDYKKSARAAYRDMTGSDYTPPAQRGTFNKTATANKSEAEALLAKYS